MSALGFDFMALIKNTNTYVTNSSYEKNKVAVNSNVYFQYNVKQFQIINILFYARMSFKSI